MNKVLNYTIPVLVLLSGLFLSTISAYYSVLGLISIFSGATMLVALMGAGMEFSKIATTLWLKKHWNDTIGSVRYVLSVFVIILMLITSMGVFAFLSKANLNQTSEIDLNSAKVTYLENTIQREEQKLQNNSNQVEQYNQLLSKLITEDIRRGSSERKRIQGEINKLSKESKILSESIDKLNVELLPYKTQIKEVEVEVGTLIYISKLVYGEEYKDKLPQVLTSMILLIVFVFDPLAILLLIASQKSIDIIRRKDNKEFGVREDYPKTPSSDKQIIPFKGVVDFGHSQEKVPVVKNIEPDYDRKGEVVSYSVTNEDYDKIVADNSLSVGYQLSNREWGDDTQKYNDENNSKSKLPENPFGYFEEGIDNATQLDKEELENDLDENYTEDGLGVNNSRKNRVRSRARRGHRPSV